MIIQHYRLTLGQAISHYQQRDLTVKGLLHFYFRIRGDSPKQTPQEICKILGIQKSSFYKSLSRLKAEGLKFQKNEIRY